MQGVELGQLVGNGISKWIESGREQGYRVGSISHKKPFALVAFHLKNLALSLQMLRVRDGAAQNGAPAQRRKQISTLIISPARELAMQINTEAKQLTKFSNFRCQVSLLGCPLSSSVQHLFTQVISTKSVVGHCRASNCCKGWMRLLLLDTAATF